MEYRLDIKSKYRNKTNYLKINKNNIDELTLKYIEENPDKYYFYTVEETLDDIDKKNIKKLLNFSKNLTILFNFFYNSDIKYLNENNIKFAFSFPVVSYQNAYELIYAGSTEIKVHGELGFNEEWQKKIKEEFNIKIIVTPQLASIYRLYVQNDSLNRIKNFFIPPRFIKNYDTIDIVDFCEPNIVKENTLYKIYAIDQRWDGNLDELISGLNVKIDERYLIKDRHLNFPAVRKNCKQRCLRSPGEKSCHSCDYLMQLSLLLADSLPNY